MASKLIQAHAALYVTSQSVSSRQQEDDALKQSPAAGVIVGRCQVFQ